ncbi:MAG: tetratricopeptide repeat protein [Dysgonamonadaceae bacterium]|jgi:tetratricopeptide (TPR) repeat protein|nr:tetratricopeptide repeat protein [Dysgonamonadaceae bacterium]
MSKKQVENKTEKGFENISETLTASEQFLEKNQKNILYGLLVVVLIVGAFFAYQHLYHKPRNLKAEAAIFKGERYFKNGQDSLALFGNGNDYDGFIAIIDQFGGTKTANLAQAYAGISYSRLGKNEEALKCLNKFKGGDYLISPAVTGAIGDVYLNMGKTDEAISYFTKAADKADNVMLSPIYLKKAGLAYLDAKNYDKAVELFTKIKDKYLNSLEAQEADKYIEEANLLKGGN